MATTIGSGLGAFAAIAPQPVYGSTWVTPTRALTFKTGKSTYDPHIVQGGPYLRNGAIVDIGSAHVQTYLDVKGTLSGDVMDVGHALLLASAMGTSAQLVQLGTTTAYELGGTNACVLGVTEQAGSTGAQFDMQWGVPIVTGVQEAQNYHSTMITKAEWVFDRTGLVTYSYDTDSQYVEGTTALISPSVPAAPIPFSMSGTNCVFTVAGSALDGVRKATITVERKFATDRIYLGNTYKDVLVTNGLVDISVSLDTDYTSQAKTALFDAWLTNTPATLAITSVGSQIGTSAHNRTFGLAITNAFLDTGGEPNPDGPDLVKNTLMFKGTLDASADPVLTATFITADTTF